jgi:hypothetical protein
MIRPARGQARPTAARPATKRTKTLPAPRKGWVVSQNYAMQEPETAIVLENYIPTTTGIRARGGKIKRATVGTSPVASLWEYIGSSTRKAFAASNGSIFDVTSVADPDVAPTADVTGRTSDYYSTPQISTVGGNFQYCFNGTDKPLLYNGSTFTPIDGVSTPAITGVTTSTLSQGWVYANRLFMVEGGTMNAWYLPVDSVGGAADVVSMNGVFERGGSLLFGATWSLDTGSGLSQKCVFVSTEGEVAVYQGTDPGDPAKWSKESVFSITRPLGQKAIMRAGGDLLIATDDSLASLSEAIRKDPAALSLSAVSRAIEPEWRKEAAARAAMPFEIIKWPRNAIMVVSLPPAFEGLENACFVCNLQTGAWAKITGWQTRCMAMVNERGWFGTNDGKIYEMDTGGSDDGVPYTASYVGAFDHLDSPGVTKTVTMARAIFRASSPLIPKISCAKNYAPDLPAVPPSPANYIVDEWDSGEWDEALWDAGAASASFSAQWVGIGQTGYSIAPQVQLTYGITPLPRVEMVAFDLAYETGGVIV